MPLCFFVCPPVSADFFLLVHVRACPPTVETYRDGDILPVFTLGLLLCQFYDRSPNVLPTAPFGAVILFLSDGTKATSQTVRVARRGPGLP